MFELIKGNEDKAENHKKQDIADLKPGDKVYPLDNTQKSSIVLSQELEKLGYVTRISRDYETRKWSVILLHKKEN